MLHEEDTFQIQLSYSTGAPSTTWLGLRSPLDAEPISIHLQRMESSDQYEIETVPFSISINEVPPLVLEATYVDGTIQFQLGFVINGWKEDADSAPNTQRFFNEDNNAVILFEKDGIVIVGTIDFGGGGIVS
jgi:hypothetical protein